MTTTNAYEGSCFCGTVRFRVTGEPVAMGYCHCESCRRWSPGPLNAFTLWRPEALHILQGAEDVAGYRKTPRSIRKWCKTCGGHLFTDHPHWGLVDVYAATMPEFPYRAAVHVTSGDALADAGWPAEAEGRAQ